MSKRVLHSYTGHDPDLTTALITGFDLNIEHTYMDSSWFASTLFDDLRYDCSRIFGLEGWHALMPGHDGYSPSTAFQRLAQISICLKETHPAETHPAEIHPAEIHPAGIRPDASHLEKSQGV